MRRRTLALVAVLAAALVLAGCNAGPTGPTANATDATNGTDAPPATTAPAQPAPGDYPPGVTEAGLTDHTALFDADWRALNESGFTAEAWTNRSTSESGATATLYRRASVEAGGQVATLTNAQTGPSGDLTTDVWRNATFGLNRLTERGPGGETTTRYRRQGEVRPLGVNPVSGGSTVSLVALGNYSVTSVEGAGQEARITLTADGLDESQRSQLGVNVTRYGGEIVVDAAGRVRSIDVTVETGGQRAMTFSVDYDLTAVGGVDVDRPDWIETGVAEAPDVDVSASVVDGRYVELRNAGPDALEAGWQVQLRTRFRPVTAELQSSVGAGETVYLFVPADGDELRVSGTAPTEQTSQLSGISGVTVAEPSSVTGQSYPVASASLNASGA